MINIPLYNKLGLGRVSIHVNDIFFLNSMSLQILVVGPLFQITALLIQFLAPPLPIFALSYAIGGIGTVFLVGIVYNHEELQAIISPFICSRMRLRMASLPLFKETLNTKWVAFRLHGVHLFLNIC